MMNSSHDSSLPPKPKLTAAATLTQHGGHWEWRRGKDQIDRREWVSDDSAL
jgi:hypothetical protein